MKRKLIGLIMVLIILVLATGCDVEESTEQKIAKQQSQIVTEASNQVGMPNVKEFYEKKLAKQIIELRDNSKLICYAYTKNEMTGKYVFEGKCIGYGLPYSVQYTNPETLQKFSAYAGSEYQIVPQADPNGLYMPDSASATWLMMINEETGKTEVQYYEPNLVVTQHKKPKRLVEEWSLPNNY